MTKLEYTFKNDTLFKAETEEDLAKIEALEVSVMQEAIGAYRRVLSAGELREIERQRSRSRHNEASALGHARREGRNEGRIEVARNALRKKLPVETIAELTGLSVAEIEQLAGEV